MTTKPRSASAARDSLSFRREPPAGFLDQEFAAAQRVVVDTAPRILIAGSDRSGRWRPERVRRKMCGGAEVVTGCRTSCALRIGRYAGKAASAATQPQILCSAIKVVTK